MAGFCLCHATALKPTHKAGRRGGESIAHQTACKQFSRSTDRW